MDLRKKFARIDARLAGHDRQHRDFPILLIVLGIGMFLFGAGLIFGWLIQ